MIRERIKTFAIKWSKKLFESFTKDITWKILSLLTAFALWFMVMSINNPLGTSTFSFNLQIENKEILDENQYILQNEEELNKTFVSVRVRARKSELAILDQNRRYAKAYIDLEPIDISRTEVLGVPMPITVYYELPSSLNSADFEIISCNPPTVSIVLDKYVEAELPVSVVKNGDGQEGYFSLQAVLSPETVTVRGAKSVVDTIGKAEVSVDLETATEDVTVSKRPRVSDKTGKDITGLLNLNVLTVEVQVPVHKYGRIAIAAPTFTGNAAEGYCFESAQWNPTFLEVVGNEADINAMKRIQLPTINIDNASQTFTKQVDLRQFLLDTNLSIKNGTPNEVKVTIYIGKESFKEIIIPIESLRIEGMSRQFELPEGSVIFTVKGSEAAIAALDIATLSPFIDLTGLDTGEHEVEVNIPLPDDIIQAAEKPVVAVKILEEMPAPSPGNGIVIQN